MVNLSVLYNEYNINIDIQLLKKEAKHLENETKETDTNTASTNILIWPSDFLPSTKYTERDSEQYMDLYERWKNEDLSVLSSKKISKILTCIDLLLIKDVNAENLLAYDGETSCVALSRIINKNRSLLGYLTDIFTEKQLFDILKYALKYKNYNLMDIVIKSLQTRRLNNKKLKKVVYYRDFLDRQDKGLYPFDWMLRYCEDFNMNTNSEVASKGFIVVLEKLAKMKEIQVEFSVSERSIHKMYIQLWEVAKKDKQALVDKKQTCNNMFIVI